ncbi:MAG: hypothetical protein ABID45_04200 [Patescibacteria group bacterium]
MSEERVKQGDFVEIQIAVRSTHQHLQRKPGANPPAPGDEALVTYQTPEGSWIQYPADDKWQWRLYVSRANESAVFCKLYVIDPAAVLFFPTGKLGAILDASEQAGEVPTCIQV